MAHAGKSKHEVVSEFRCGEILAAARKVFAASGFSEATMDDIASAAGIAKGTVYLYFSSKKDIYLAALKQGLTELRDRTRTNMKAANGIQDRLRAFVRTRLEYAEANRDFIKIYHSEFGNLTNAAAHDSEFQQLYLMQAKELEKVLRSAMETGDIRRMRSDFTAFIIYDMVKGVMTQRLLEWSGAPLEEDIELLSELIWKGIAAS
jgi:AcrR family transcriptional regulator